MRSGVVAAGALAFVADVFGDVFALNRTELDVGGGNHTVVWSALVGTNPTTPDVSTNSVLVGDSVGLVSAFDIETGGLRWSHSLNGSIVDGVAVVNGTVYVGTSTGVVAALSLAFGTVNWTTSLGPAVSGAVAVANGRVFASTVDGGLTALAAGTGAILWRTSIGGSLSAGPAVLGDRVALVDNATAVGVWNTGNGSLLWRWNGSAASPGDRAEAAPVLNPTTVFVHTHEANLYAFNLSTGAIRWNQSNTFFHTGYPALSTPAVTANVVYAYDATQQLKAISLTTGRVLWRATFGTVSYAPVAVDSGEVLIGDETGCVHVVGSGSSGFPWPVRGVVTDTNGTPLPHVSVFTNLGLNTTNASGGFFLGLPNGTYDLAFALSGYEEIHQILVVTGPVPDDQVVLPKIVVHPLSGRVVDSYSGLGVPGVQLYIYGVDLFLVAVTSGPGGAFEVGAPQGAVEISAQPSDQHDGVVVTVAMPAGPLSGVTVGVPPTGLPISPNDPYDVFILLPLAALATAGGGVAVLAARARRVTIGLPPAILSRFARYVLQRSLLLPAQLVTILTVLYIFGTYIPAAATQTPVCNFSALSCGYCAWSNPGCVAQAFGSGYGLFLWNLFSGNWGTTSYGHLVEPAWTFFVWYVPYSIELAGVALAISAVSAYVIGLTAGWNRDRPLDVGVRTASVIGLLVPSFLVVLAMFSVLYTPFLRFFGDTPFGVLPAPGWFEDRGSIPKWIGIAYNTTPTGLPILDAALNGAWRVVVITSAKTLLQALLIAAIYVPLFLRYARNAVAQAAEEPHVVAARARGIPESTIRWRHTGRRVIPIFLLAFAATLPLYIGTQSLVEAMTSDPGIGSLLLTQMTTFLRSGFGFHPAPGASKPGNFYQVTIFLLVAVVLIGTLASEILSRYLDPRSGRSENS
ncbi:MAG: PQQ-binding-like beta-propeller repeat protein [Thermoplasmata archaeon]|nr:PQQ-binding-like beta-propeller repeat protein [Thermoplasmata archaeon]MCI4356329.1 PQQ-binding-like beta-propeller repeat protein [Thermoplasmata archaeon]